jgi:hypothetical protein
MILVYYPANISSQVYALIAAIDQKHGRMSPYESRPRKLGTRLRVHERGISSP